MDQVCGGAEPSMLFDELALSEALNRGAIRSIWFDALDPTGWKPAFIGDAAAACVTERLANQTRGPLRGLPGPLRGASMKCRQLRRARCSRSSPTVALKSATPGALLLDHGSRRARATKLSFPAWRWP